jgi:uncharacterized protein
VIHQSRAHGRREPCLTYPLPVDRVSDMNESHLHSSHGDVVVRLRRAEGHLRNVIEMIDAKRGCLDVAQQLHAVEKAISAAKKLLIHDHLDHCLEETIGPVPRSKRTAIDEFKEITKYL